MTSNATNCNRCIVACESGPRAEGRVYTESRRESSEMRDAPSCFADVTRHFALCSAERIKTKHESVKTDKSQKTHNEIIASLALSQRLRNDSDVVWVKQQNTQ